MAEQHRDDDDAAPAGRNLVICLDGTSNEPEKGYTNVARLFDVAAKTDRQLVYYDPGVGTMGSRAAVTSLGLAATRAAGMVAGAGIRDNLEQAYAWLANHYRDGDRIFVFGFSRGAYTARALTGMLSTVGLLHAGADNLVPYAVKLYATNGPSRRDTEDGEARRRATQAYFAPRRKFFDTFGNPDFPSVFDNRKQVRFLGLWDTVKAVGWLNLKARIEMARWPFTANLAGVDIARHALAIDEKRRPFAEYRIKPEAVTKSEGRFQEMWFAGVHGDIGGSPSEQDKLPDIAFAWMVQEAHTAGMDVDHDRYESAVGCALGAELPDNRPLGTITPNFWPWCLAGGWRRRPIRPGDQVHPSVYARVDGLSSAARPYRPHNLPVPVTGQQLRE